MTENRPLDPTSRIESIDVIRGWALLGILVINIMMFANPFETSYNPSLLQTFEGIDLTAFFVSWIGFEGSQRALFSMLFGASIILLTSRLETGDRLEQAKTIYYRRTWLLIGFGLIDIVVFLWYGDILLLYGWLGLILYYARNASPKKLITIASIIVILLMLLNLGLTAAVNASEIYANAINEKVLSGEALTEAEISTRDSLASIGLIPPTPEYLQSAIQERGGGYFSAFVPNLWHAVELQVVDTLIMLAWDAMAMMMLGMALYKLGVFNAELSFRAYVAMFVLGFGIGLSVNAYEMINSVENNYRLTYIDPTYQIGRISTAFGYIGLFMLICKANVFGWLRDSLAAVGKMALTNYLMHSVICLILFVILGWYGKLRFHEYYYVVIVIWIFQIAFSRYWLSRHRYGPVEWLWRSLTYKKRI